MVLNEGSYIMGLKEKFEEINKDPHAIYYYIVGILAVLLTIGLISNPRAMGETISSIFGLIVWLIICYLCYKFCGRSQHQQQQQQQQQIIMQTGDNKQRVCPKCGMQNDVANRFCSDCGYEFETRNN